MANETYQGSLAGGPRDEQFLPLMTRTVPHKSSSKAGKHVQGITVNTGNRSQYQRAERTSTQDKTAAPRSNGSLLAEMI